MKEDKKQEVKPEENVKRSLSIKEMHETKQTERQQKMQELGYKENVQLKEGENYLEIDTSKNIKEIDTIFGLKYIYELKQPENKTLKASDYLNRLVLSRLAQKEDGKINIHKFKDGSKVKYKVLDANDAV